MKTPTATYCNRERRITDGCGHVDQTVNRRHRRTTVKNPVAKTAAAAFVLLAGTACATTSVSVGNARFTLLTDRMVRCEWSADGTFEDRPSLIFVNREMPGVDHTLERRGEGAVIETGRMRLVWTGGPFNENNLVVSVRAHGDTILPPVAVLAEDKENLLGTMRTLDGRSSIPDLLPRMERGLLSRRGVTVVDDTVTPLFVKGGDYWKEWVAARPRRETENGTYRDITIFAYGHDYKGCLGDYVKVAGRIPLPPRWAFGYWWSRFWPDSDSDYREVVRTMDSLGIPMDVCVIEMYWHETWNIGDRPDLRDASGQRVGWGGYTWNRRYFPDPQATFRFLHENGLKAPLNVHPACGIPPMEACFGRFARDYGWTGTNTIPFRAEEERWAEVFFKDVIEPLEEDGADFFWLDWQQWLMSKGVRGLGNTFWLNHLFNTHAARRDGGVRRPIIYHRWGGLGSHRYQIGFSGDGKVSWGMLEAIPWFTASASNVGYGYWGHDLGGHMKPEGDDGANGELYTRWLQCGVFTPIFRTHTTKDRRLERRIWKFGDHFLTLREAFRLRYRLAPYIYTAAREAYDTGVSMCRPMYYDWPEVEAAYAATNAFLFGRDVLVAPVSKPADTLIGEAEVEVWLPEGTWYDVSKGELVQTGEGGTRLSRSYRVEETPWFVKGGSIIPMYPDTVKRLGNPGTDDLVLFCAPCGTSDISSVETSIYEDDGDNADYATNFRRTYIRREGNRVTIGPRKGTYTLKFPLAAPPAWVKVDGRPCAWTYDAEDLAVVVKTTPQDGVHETVVELAGRENLALSGLKGEYTRVAALTEDFRKALAGNGPGSRRTRPEYVANLPESWQTYWKTRDAVAANPVEAKRILAERDAAIQAFVADFLRMESGVPDADFCRKMHSWLGKAVRAADRKRSLHTK
ncbi:MAG: glycosyl hydrolase family 31 [Kiritimatiellae bacterium]|nr:glycosyl hydrolase family 31 [Kiritimatiellia bacterium]